MDPELYCRDKASLPGSGFYYARLFHTPPEQARLHCLFALQQELDDTVLDCQDPGVARMKLQWWLEEIARLYDGHPRHPVSRALLAGALHRQIEKLQVDELINLAGEDIQPRQATSVSALIAEKTRTRGLLWRLAADAMETQDKDYSAIAASLGGHCAAVSTIQGAWKQLGRGFCIYPRDVLARHGLEADFLQDEANAPILKRLNRELFDGLQAGLGGQLSRIEGQHCPAILFAISLSRMAMANCSMLGKQADIRLLQATGITPLRKLWIAWRTKKQFAR